MKRYVQSKWSKDAPVWEVFKEDKNCYELDFPNRHLALPKSEYHEVPAPERWERCGSDRITVRTDKLSLVVDGKQVGFLQSNYRWAWDKQEDGTLVIERRVEP